MAWEISHSQEAWDNVRSNLEHWSCERLIDALADDAFEEQEEAGHEGAQAADVLHDDLADAHQCDLVEMAMASIATQRTCSNGGHEFYIDRKGIDRVSVTLGAPALTVCPNCDQYRTSGGDCFNDCKARGFA